MHGYFVYAYRILSYLEGCYMAGETPDSEMYCAEALKINNGYWLNIMETLYDEGYIKGIAFVDSIGSCKGVKILDIKITQKGMEFLAENTMIAKAKKLLKSVKETVPGF